MVIKLVKKFIMVFALISLIFSFAVYGEEIVTLKTDNTFSVFPEDATALSRILGMKKEDIDNYCKQNNIAYLAVDNKNTRQIRVSVYSDDFSNSVINISGLSDDKISALTEDIVGISGIRGEIVNKNGQKFLKTQLRSDDSGGGYILTQYFTVAERQNIVLSFYNSENIDIDYINSIFESYDSPLFINEKPQESKTLYFIIPTAIGVLLIVSLILGVSIYKDLKSAKEVEYDENGIPVDSEEDL